MERSHTIERISAGSFEKEVNDSWNDDVETGVSIFGDFFRGISGSLASKMYWSTGYYKLNDICYLLPGPKT